MQKIASSNIKIVTDVNQILNMTVTKADVLALFEDSAVTELQEKLKSLEQLKTNLDSKITEVQNTIETLLAEEKERIKDEYIKILVPIMGDVKFQAEIQDGGDNNIVLRGGAIANEESMFMHPFINPAMLYSLCHKRTVRSSIQLVIPFSEETLKKIDNLKKEKSVLNEEFQANYSKICSVKNEISDFPNRVKKFSAGLIRKALAQTKDGQGVLNLVQQLNDQLNNPKQLEVIPEKVVPPQKKKRIKKAS
jgi:prefoldin subunit 5